MNSTKFRQKQHRKKSKNELTEKNFLKNIWTIKKNVCLRKICNIPGLQQTTDHDWTSSHLAYNEDGNHVHKEHSVQAQLAVNML